MVTKAWGRVGVLLAFPIAACSTLVGADFDGLGPVASGGSAGSSSNGGSSTAGTEAGGGAGLDRVPLGGAAGDSGGAGQAGSAQAGTAMGGNAGEPNGGAAGEGGATEGGAGNAGDSAGGAGGSPDVGVPPTDVVINELKGQGSGEDYIELYNPGAEVADIGGCYVVDDSNNRVTFPQGATIGAESYVVVRLQRTTSTGMVTNCFGFTPCYDGITWGIAASGEVIFFHDSKGILLDQLAYPDEAGAQGVADGHSFGRIPNGAVTTGEIFTSPGAANNAVPMP
jgi:hypothetical protein